jgi:short subunit dehydrogenase-like uncharacterized protein
MSNWLLYGAYGYTGARIARLAVERGERPTLAGRNPDATATLAAELGLPYCALGLDDPARLREALGGFRAVLHCAGPFSATSRPMADACLDVGVHYLDITGEIAVFEALAARTEEARAAGVCLLPGVGFDVVPTDCLAALLAERLPGANELELAFKGAGTPSRGTARTMLEVARDGGAARVNGRIERVPLAWKTMEVPFPSGPRMAAAIPWGDVSTAFTSTGIPNITVYLAMPRGNLRALPWLDRLAPLLGSTASQSILRRVVDRQAHGPSAATTATGRSEVWGRVRHPDGRSVTGTLTCPEGYRLTADSALRAIVRRDDLPAGFQTPSTALGARFISECEGVTLDVD